jgi:tetratricopeptide (TPR) repeat protein
MAHAPADASRDAFASATDPAAYTAADPASRPYAAADPHAALELAARLLEQAHATGRPGLMADACHRLARCWRALGERRAALAALERALPWARTSGAYDQALDLQCEMAELLADMATRADRGERGSGRPLRERARDAVFEVARAAAGCADPRWEVMLLLRISDVLDRFGDHDDATVLQVRALRLTATEFYGEPAPRAEDAVRVRVH